MTERDQIATEPPDFDALYGANDDPWRVQTSWYERRKLAVLLASLPKARYRSAWEPGCGPGLTSPALARRCDSLLATDSSAVAVETARRRCPDDSVEFRVSGLPEMATSGRVELVVVAEFLYYVEAFDASLETLWNSLARDGQLAFVHWVHEPEDAYRSGRAMHASIALDATARHATRLVAHVDTDFIIDIYAGSP